MLCDAATVGQTVPLGSRRWPDQRLAATGDCGVRSTGQIAPVPETCWVANRLLLFAPLAVLLAPALLAPLAILLAPALQRLAVRVMSLTSAEPLGAASALSATAISRPSRSLCAITTSRLAQLSCELRRPMPNHGGLGAPQHLHGIGGRFADA